MARARISALAAVLAVGLAACGAPAEPSGLSVEPDATVGFILVGERGDLGYNQAVGEGINDAARAFANVRIITRENVPETAQSAVVMQEMIDNEGADLIFATSFGHRDHALDIARRNPDVVVVHQGGVESRDEDLDNFGTYFGAHWDAMFQAGIASAVLADGEPLGFVAAFPIPAVYSNVNAFTLGAQSVRPDSTTQVVFTDDWCDPAAQTAAAKRLLAVGVRVLAQHQDCTASVLKVARDNGVWAVGYHADGSEVAGDAWVTGAVWDWSGVYTAIIQTVLDGQFVGSAWAGDFRGASADGNNPFLLTTFGPDVTQDAEQAALDAQRELKAGQLRVFEGPLADVDGTIRVAKGTTLSQAEIDAMDYFVRGVRVLDQ